jgi:hypothetical protein
MGYRDVHREEAHTSSVLDRERTPMAEPWRNHGGIYLASPAAPVNRLSRHEEGDGERGYLRSGSRSPGQGADKDRPAARRRVYTSSFVTDVHTAARTHLARTRTRSPCSTMVSCVHATAVPAERGSRDKNTRRRGKEKRRWWWWWRRWNAYRGIRAVHAISVSASRPVGEALSSLCCGVSNLHRPSPWYIEQTRVAT